MRLQARDYELLIKNYAGEVGGFSKDTSLSYAYMETTCSRLIEISKEYRAEYPKEAKRFSDGE